MTDEKQAKPDGDDVPAYFLEALLTTDIPPYLTDASGDTKIFAQDSLAAELAAELDELPESEPPVGKKSKGKKGKKRKKG